MILLAVLTLTTHTLVGAGVFLAADLVTALSDLPAAQVVLAQTLHWTAEFDSRLLGCPTILIEPH